MIIKIPKEFDSKFRFIVVAAERAKQIQSGAPPKMGGANWKTSSYSDSGSPGEPGSLRDSF